MEVGLDGEAQGRKGKSVKAIRLHNSLFDEQNRAFKAVEQQAFGKRAIGSEDSGDELGF